MTALLSATPAPPDLPLLLTEKQVAAKLGLSISTIRHWRFYATPGTPAHLKIGSAVRYRASDVEAWVAGYPSVRAEGGVL